MALFEKKICSICGNEIKLLGNRKLSDGNMCKDCASKLSPWFSERRSSTIEEIKKQLEYRAANEAALGSLNPTKVLGDSTKVYLDEAAKKFVVTRSSDWKKNNPDIVSLDQVKDVLVEIDEDKDELFEEDSDGNSKSYDPPKYEYSYEFDMKILADSPWFDDMDFELSGDEPDSKYSEEYKALLFMAKEIQHALMPSKYPMPTMEGIEAEIGEPEPEEWTCECGTANKGDFCTHCGKPNPNKSEEWTCECGTVNTGNFCSKCGKPKTAKWFCPKCGKENIDNFCASCGTKKPDNI